MSSSICWAVWPPVLGSGCGKGSGDDPNILNKSVETPSPDLLEFSCPFEWGIPKGESKLAANGDNDWGSMAEIGRAHV